MHIDFNNIEFKNLLSVGNSAVNVSLDKSPITVSCGSNGNGKTLIIEALYYALYGKPFRKIKVGELVNNVNKKGLLVTLNFTIGKKKYKIERGIKPKVFKIYENNKEIDQSASSIDFQRELEYTILKMSPDTFRQIVVLGSSSYVPYMRLTKAARDNIIEDLLDIQVFSTMLKLTTENMRSEKRKLTEIDHSIALLNNTITTTENHISQLEDNNKRVGEDNTQQKSEIEDAQKLSEEKLEKVLATITKINFDASKLNEYRSDRQKVARDRIKINTLRANDEKQHEFFEKNSTCPTCTQSIEESFRQSKLKELSTAIEKYNSEDEKLDSLLTKIDDLINAESEKQTAVNELSTAKSNLEVRLDSLASSLSKLSQSVNFIDVQPSLDKIKELKKEIKTAKTTKTKTQRKVEEFEFIQEMLNNKGIKSSIVKTYLPVINDLISKYLGILEFEANFKFDETFSETIESDGTQPITYNALSDGQKLRIDLALLFAFRDVSRIKNSTSTNLIIFDEIGDNSLDEAGVNALMSIFVELSSKDTNIYVISHNEEIQSNENVSRLIEVKRESNFTIYKEN